MLPRGRNMQTARMQATGTPRRARAPSDESDEPPGFDSRAVRPRLAAPSLASPPGFAVTTARPGGPDGAAPAAAAPLLGAGAPSTDGAAELRRKLQAAQQQRASVEALLVRDLDLVSDAERRRALAVAAAESAGASISRLEHELESERNEQTLSRRTEAACARSVADFQRRADRLAAEKLETTKQELRLLIELRNVLAVPHGLASIWTTCGVCLESTLHALSCSSDTSPPHGVCFPCVPLLIRQARANASRLGADVRCCRAATPDGCTGSPFDHELLDFALSLAAVQEVATDAELAAARDNLSYLRAMPFIEAAAQEAARGPAKEGSAVAMLANACVAGSCPGCGVAVTSTDAQSCGVGICDCTTHFCSCCYGFGIRAAFNDHDVHHHIEECPVNIDIGNFMCLKKKEQLAASRSLLAARAVRNDRGLRLELATAGALANALTAASDLDVETLNSMDLRFCGPGKPLMPRVDACPLRVQPRIYATLAAVQRGEPTVRFCRRNDAETLPALTVCFADLDRQALLDEVFAKPATQQDYQTLGSHFRRLSAYCERIFGGRRDTLEGQFVLNLASVQLAALRAVAARGFLADPPFCGQLIDLVASLPFRGVPALADAEAARQVPVWEPWEARVRAVTSRGAALPMHDVIVVD